MLITDSLGSLMLTLGVRFLMGKIKRLEYIALRPLKMLTLKLLKKLETGFLGDNRMRAKMRLSSLD